MPEPRDSVKRMRPYSPPTGGRHDKLRLDFNENTVGCSPKVAEFLKQAVTGDLLATYPDYDAVRTDLATFFKVQKSELLLTNGTDEAIQVLVNTFVEPNDQVIVLTPSYAMYRFYAEVAGAEIVEVPYGREERGKRNDEEEGLGFVIPRDEGSRSQQPWTPVENEIPRKLGMTKETQRDLAFNLKRLLTAVTRRTKAILLANPNNPTGTAICPDDIAAILRHATQACVLVDEAYFEFYGQTMLPQINAFENLFVSRTFSKAYGLAAMRMGCLMSNEKNASAMRKAQSPYSVNMLAALAAQEAIKDRPYTAEYVHSALAGRRMIEATLTRLAIRHWPSQANFVLFDAGDRADDCVARCRAAGVLIRDRRHEIPGALRVTAGREEQMRRFVQVVEELFNA